MPPAPPPAAAQPWRRSPAPPNGRPRGGAERRHATEGGPSCTGCGACPPAAASSSVGFLSPRPPPPLLPRHSPATPTLCAYVAVLRLPRAVRSPSRSAAPLGGAGEMERLRRTAGASSPRLPGRARSRGRTAAPGAARGGRGSRRGGRQLSRAP